MHCVFVNRFYRPAEPATAQLLRDLAEGLAAAGHTVTVVASRPTGGNNPRTEVLDGVTVRRVGGCSPAGHGVLRRCWDFARFAVAACWVVLRILRRDDVLVSLTDPPLLGIGLTALAKIRGARMIHWVQDVYPELALCLAPHPAVRFVLRPLVPVRNASWRRSTACVVLGADMAAVLSRGGVAPQRIHVVANWAPIGLEGSEGLALRREWELGDRFVIAYSGNLGRVHELEPVLALATALAASPRIVFLFIGDGPQRPALERQARARGLAQVWFRPAQPRHQLAQSLAVADVHLVTLRRGCESLVFPSKLYGIAAAGRPALYFGPTDCEVARLIRQHRFGHAFEPAQIDAAAAVLQALAADRNACLQLGEAALEFHRQSGGFAAALQQWRNLLEGFGQIGRPD